VCGSCTEVLPSQTHQPKLDTPPKTAPGQLWHGDLLTCNGLHYLVVVDNFSGWPYLASLGRDTMSQRVIKALQSFVEAHGAPAMFRSDGGPQLASHETGTWLQRWGIIREITSPALPRTNGHAEAMVKIVKKIIRGATAAGAQDPDWERVVTGLLAYQNTPRAGGGWSPAQLMFGGGDLRPSST
jgi:transposase InsO family protein